MGEPSRQWVVSIEYVIGSLDDSFPPGDKRVQYLDRWLAHAYGGSAFATERGWIAKVLITEDVRVLSMDNAQILGERKIAHCVETLNFPSSELVARSVIHANTYVAELEVVGSRELSKLLNVSRQRLAQLRAEGTLPEPDAVLAATPVWKRATIDSFTFGWRRRPGPAPSKAVPDLEFDRIISGQ